MRIAPSDGPTAAPRAAEAPQMPITMERRSGGNSGSTIDMDEGPRMEPPTPCRTRAETSHVTLSAIPDRKDPTTNTPTPIMNRRRRPFWSARRPASRRKAPTEME